MAEYGETGGTLRVLPLRIEAAEESALAIPAARTQPMPFLPVPAERLVFAMGAPVPLAATAGVMAPAFLSEATAPSLAPAASGAPLSVKTAPRTAAFLTPHVAMAEPAIGLRMPRLEIAAIEPHLAPVPVPQVNGHWTANPVTDSIYATPSDGTVDPKEPQTHLPQFQIVAFEPSLAPPPMQEPRARWTPNSPAEPNHKLAAPNAASLPPALLRLPKFHLPPPEAQYKPVQVPQACQHWMPNLAAEAVEIEVTSICAPESLGIPDSVLPGFATFSVVETWMPVCVNLKPSLVAEPVSMRVWPKSEATAMPVYDELPEIRVPDGNLLETADAGSHSVLVAMAATGLLAEPVECMVLPHADTTLAEQTAERTFRMPALFPLDTTVRVAAAAHAQGLAAEAVESMPSCAACVPAPVSAPRAIHLPAFPDFVVEEPALAGSTPAAATGVRVATRPAASQDVPVEPVRTLFVRPPAPYQSDPPAAAVATRGFVPLDFYCQRNSGSPSGRMNWQSAVNRPILPGLSIHPIHERLEESTPAKKTDGPGFAYIFSLPEVARRNAGNKTVRHAIRALAACLFLGAVLWFGMGALQIGSQTPAVNRDVAFGELASNPGARSLTPNIGVPGGPRPSAAKPGTMSRLRAAISDRAAASLSDSFRNGMEAWGTASKQFAPGWSRNPDGYVSPGQLALFHPSLGYKDYHLEFFGQIENRGMGWAVRARDTQNYYAMKLAVKEPGLRPVIAMVHYPVVGGKKGRPIEIPLNVMVHNNKPMQVDVEVHGDKLLTSVDGQLVDTWVDETLVAGGVGFFSEAGERARLYWMRVSKNEDFLGRVCAYIANTLGDGSRATADLWPGEIPDVPQPQPQPAKERAHEAALASAATTLETRLSKDSKRDKWNS